MKSLQKELETYNVNREKLMAHIGSWVLISGDAIIDYYPNYASAISAGYERVGVKASFLVKEIEEVERIHFIPTA